jgi:hypothetical protein
VILSIAGVDQVPQLEYYRAETLQEDLLRQGSTPYSIVRATHFFEFMNTVVTETSDDTTVRLPSTRLQPIAAADVADAVVEVSTGPPLRGIRNLAGPDVFPLDELGRLTLAVRHDNGPSSPTTTPACSRASPATCSPQARMHTWHRRTARTGSRRPGNWAVGYPGTTPDPRASPGSVGSCWALRVSASTCGPVGYWRPAKPS